jgi:2-methylcitrate dehydratase PrpD
MPSTSPTIAETLARFVSSLDYDALPASVREKARLHLLDSVGVGLASCGFEFAQRAFAGLNRFGTGDYEVIGMRGKLSLRDAVCMNGILVHGIEFDDTSILGRIHPSASCAPTALGVGAFARTDGKALLTAYILGVECAIRIGAAAKGGFSPAGFNATGVVGGFGAVMVSGKLLGLGTEQLTSAQGLVYSTAAGNREFVTSDAWTKRMDPAWAAVGGVTSAMLAAEGYVGPSTPYEGKFGLYRVYLDRHVSDEDLHTLTAELGATWHFAELSLKAVPSCYFNHPIINATIAIVTKHQLAPSAIRSIRVLLPQAAIDTVCEPKASKLAPGDLASALFSAYYNVASAAVHRRLSLDQLAPAALADPDVLALASKVGYAIDPESNFPRHYSGAVEITTLDGRVLTEREMVNRGSAERPLNQAEVEAKFLENARRVMPRQRAEALRDAFLGIDKVADVSMLALGLDAY